MLSLPRGRAAAYMGHALEAVRAGDLRGALHALQEAALDEQRQPDSVLQVEQGEAAACLRSCLCAACLWARRQALPSLADAPDEPTAPASPRAFHAEAAVR